MPACMTADQPSNGYADPQWDRGRLAAEAQSREGVGTDATRAREGRSSCGCGRWTSNASRSLCLCPAALCASAANLPLEGEGGQNGMSSSPPPEEAPWAKSSYGASDGMSPLPPPAARGASRRGAPPSRGAPAPSPRPRPERTMLLATTSVE